MNRYDFYHNGEFYVGCYTNDVAEMHISACADLARRGETPHYWHNPDTGKDILMYTDSFKVTIERPDYTGNRYSVEVTPDNVGTVVCKAIREQLSAFDYVGGEWVYNGKVVK